MGNIGGRRNYGYGNQLVWAGQKVLLDRYGNGHYATRAAHSERWSQFAKYIMEQNINDDRNITKEVIEQYANTLKQSVEGKTLTVAYAQNLLSTVNVVLETMRKDRELAVSPRQWVGERSQLRTTIPVSVNKDVLQQINNVLNVNTQSQTTQTDSQSDKLSLQRNLFTSRVNHACTNNVTLLHSDSRQHVLVIARLARDFGLRFDGKLGQLNRGRPPKLAYRKHTTGFRNSSIN